MKLLSRPDQQTIMALRGHVDLYVDKGIWVGRKWPVKSKQPRLAPSKESSELFTAAAVWTSCISDNLRKEWTAQVQGQGVTWIDAFRGSVRGQSWWEFVPPA